MAQSRAPKLLPVLLTLEGVKYQQFCLVKIGRGAYRDTHTHARLHAVPRVVRE